MVWGDCFTRSGVVRHACRHRVTARGVFGLGGFFHTLRSGWHERVRGGGFNPLRGATTGVVMRRRATSGEMARGGLVFVFSLDVAPMSEGDSFTGSGVVRHACRHRVTARGIFGLGRLFHTLRSVHTLRTIGGPAIRGALIWGLEDSFTRYSAAAFFLSVSCDGPSGHFEHIASHASRTAAQSAGRTDSRAKSPRPPAATSGKSAISELSRFTTLNFIPFFIPPSKLRRSRISPAPNLHCKMRE